MYVFADVNVCLGINPRQDRIDRLQALADDGLLDWKTKRFNERKW